MLTSYSGHSSGRPLSPTNSQCQPESTTWGSWEPLEPQQGKKPVILRRGWNIWAGNIPAQHFYLSLPSRSGLLAAGGVRLFRIFRFFPLLAGIGVVWVNVPFLCGS